MGRTRDKEWDNGQWATARSDGELRRRWEGWCARVARALTLAWAGMGRAVRAGGGLSRVQKDGRAGGLGGAVRRRNMAAERGGDGVWSTSASGRGVVAPAWQVLWRAGARGAAMQCARAGGAGRAPCGQMVVGGERRRRWAHGPRRGERARGEEAEHEKRFVR